jgi:pimeloyl-ACP methyl ester carboxylesterase
MTATSEAYTDIMVEMMAGKVHLLKGGSGQPLLVLHHDIGSFGWQDFHGRLAEDYSVLAPDLPGFGQSDRPDSARHTRDLAIHMLLLLDRLGIDQVSIVGLGYGGWLAAEMATMNQKRLRKLVLVAPAGLQPQDGVILDQFLLNASDYVSAGFVEPAAFQNQFGTDVAAETTWLWESAREMTARINWKPYMFSQQLPYLLKDVEVPTLIVFGGKDRIVPPACGELYAKTLPNSRLHMLPEAGHFIDMEFPEALAGLVKSHLGMPWS